MIMIEFRDDILCLNLELPKKIGELKVFLCVLGEEGSWKEHTMSLMLLWDNLAHN